MKKLIVTFISFAALSSGAFASDRPVNLNGVVAYVETDGGLMAFHDLLQVQANGTVVYEDSQQNAGKTQTFAKLSALKVEQLKARIAAVKQGELVDSDPQSPPCMDAPVTRTFVVQNGREIEIARYSMCHKLTLSNDSETYVLTDVLDGLRSINELRR